MTNKESSIQVMIETNDKRHFRASELDRSFDTEPSSLDILFPVKLTDDDRQDLLILERYEN